MLQAGTSLTINTHGQTLTNTNAAARPVSAGGITSSGSLALNTGALNNAGGYVGAIGAITGSTGQITNTVSNGAGGQIVGQGGLNLSISGLNNQGGQLQNLAGITLNAGAGSIDNRQGLVRAGGDVTLAAASINKIGRAHV